MSQILDGRHAVKSGKEALKLLSIPMMKKDVRVVGQKEVVERYQAVVREDTNQVMSMVSPGYKLIGHGQALQGLIQGLEQGGWDIRKVNLEQSGARAYVTAVCRGHGFDAAKGDPLFPAITMSNSVDLRSSLRFGLGMHRQVCSNGLTIPDPRFGILNFKAVHVGPMMEHFQEFSQQVTDRLKELKEVAPIYQGMANTLVSHATAEKILMAMSGKRLIERLTHIWQGGVPGQSATPSTQWDLYNAITYWLTHEASGGVYYRDLRSQKALKMILNIGKRSIN